MIQPHAHARHGWPGSQGVRTSGQRGDGVYDVAFEGADQRMCSGVTARPAPTRMKQEYESYMRITPCAEPAAGSD